MCQISLGHLLLKVNNADTTDTSEAFVAIAMPSINFDNIGLIEMIPAAGAASRLKLNIYAVGGFDNEYAVISP